jgi:Uma2 family endonuclease
MLLTTPIQKRYTIEEYLDLEAQSEEKNEFLNGKIITMPGGTVNHSLIATNITTALNIALDETEHIVLNSDIKIHIPRFRHFVYPDAVVICKAIEYYENRRDIILNPILIVEVLSSSTEDYDKNSKFIKYRTIPSFKEYVLVSQDEPFITSFFHKDEKTWIEENVDDLTKGIFLPSLNIELPLAKVYKGVKFEIN